MSKKVNVPGLKQKQEDREGIAYALSQENDFMRLIEDVLRYMREVTPMLEDLKRRVELLEAAQKKRGTARK